MTMRVNHGLNVCGKASDVTRKARSCDRAGEQKGVLPKSEDYDKTRALGPNQGPAARRLPQAVDADALKPGTLAGAYVLKKELASGGGGTVYEAHHRILGRRAAVKVLRRQLAASPQMVARFVQEARAVNMIKHPSIVDIFEFDDLPDGRPFYVMELLEGIDLRSILNERGRFPPGEVLEILEPVCSALQAAHDLRHRPPRPQGEQHLHRQDRQR